MKKLIIPFAEKIDDFEDLSLFFEDLPAYKIDQVSWSEYPYLPDVDFKIAYTDHSVVLEYKIKEKYLKSIYLKTNEPVYKDSCVEFFISFDDVHYYNFEFNSLGTALVGYGSADRGSRKYLPVPLIQKIQTKGARKSSKIKGVDNEWSLQLLIPFEVFYNENLESLKGKNATANFYKCGDDLPEPHFVSWNRIEAPEPDFHIPKYFGKVEFR